MRYTNTRLLLLLLLLLLRSGKSEAELALDEAKRHEASRSLFATV